MEPRLFELLCVQGKIKDIWEDEFSSHSSPPRAWSCVAKETQTMLIAIRKEVTLIIRKEGRIFSKSW